MTKEYHPKAWGAGRQAALEAEARALIARIPQQQARDQRAVADYLRDIAAKIDRAECDPYGVVVVLVGPDQEDVGSRGLVYLHDYRRASRALSRVVTDAIVSRGAADAMNERLG